MKRISSILSSCLLVFVLLMTTNPNTSHAYPLCDIKSVNPLLIKPNLHALSTEDVGGLTDLLPFG